MRVRVNEVRILIRVAVRFPSGIPHPHLLGVCCPNHFFCTSPVGEARLRPRETEFGLASDFVPHPSLPGLKRALRLVVKVMADNAFRIGRTNAKRKSAPAWSVSGNYQPAMMATMDGKQKASSGRSCSGPGEINPPTPLIFLTRLATFNSFGCIDRQRL
jgi:hypothetical protein